MKNRVVVDGIEKIYFMNGLVRIDLYALDGEKNDKTEQENVVQLTMSPQAFLTMFDTSQKFVDRLAEADVFQKKDA